MSGAAKVSFGSWLLERRRAAGITQDELAERIDCAPITLQKIVSGKRRPSRQIALLLAAYFGVPEDEHEAFVTFARAPLPTPGVSPGVSSPASLTSLIARPGDPADLAKEDQPNASQAAPWRAVHLSKSNLPMVLTILIGREGELADVCTRLMQPKTRLLTITGSPGTGKTRLAIEVATALLGDFEDGVYLVDLAPVSDPSAVILAIARALDLHEAVGQSIEDTLLGHIKDKRILLVLDNFEHLLDAGTQVVKLVQASPWLKALITSREALHVRGERQYPLPPLRLPVLASRPGPEELARNPAVQLFVERAQSVVADFALTEENALEVAEVCVHLSGLPLAIELAAGRVSLFPPRILLSRLGQQLRVLTGGSRDLPPRQRTLRAAIEWSYNLLDAGHQEFFRRMAVFWGGRTLQGLEAVCNSPSLATEGKKLKVDVLDGVETLLSSNLLQQREGSDGEPRFWMLETIQEYAREKLEESGEGQILQREHALYFMKLAEEGEPHLKDKEQQIWVERLEDEYNNLRTALEWGLEQGRRGSQEGAEIGLRTAGALSRFWQVKSLLTEGRDRLEMALSVPEEVLQECSPGSRARALAAAGFLALKQGDYAEARSLSEGSLVLGREVGDKQSLSRSLNNLAGVAYEQGDYTGSGALYEESLALLRELGDKWGISMSLNNLGVVSYELGDYTRSRTLHEESVALFREIGDTWSLTLSLNNLGVVVYELGDYAEACTLHEEGLALRREVGDKGGMVLSLNNLGFVASSQGDYVGAGALHEEGLALAKEIGGKKGVVMGLIGLGGVAVGMGQVERGAKLLGAVHELVENMGGVLQRDERVPYEQAIASARVQLGEEEFEKAWQEGRALSMEQAVAYALGEQ